MTGERLGYVPSDLGSDSEPERELSKEGLCLEVERSEGYATPPHLYVVALIPMDRGTMDEKSLS